MNKIKIMNKNGDVLFELEGYFVPNVGECIWLDDNINNADVRTVKGRIIDLDKARKRFNITLIVE